MSLTSWRERKPSPSPQNQSNTAEFTSWCQAASGMDIAKWRKEFAVWVSLSKKLLSECFWQGSPEGLGRERGVQYEISILRHEQANHR